MRDLVALRLDHPTATGHPLHYRPDYWHSWRPDRRQTTPTSGTLIFPIMPTRGKEATKLRFVSRKNVERTHFGNILPPCESRGRVGWTGFNPDLCCVDRKQWPRVQLRQGDLRSAQHVDDPSREFLTACKKRTVRC